METSVGCDFAIVGISALEENVDSLSPSVMGVSVLSSYPELVDFSVGALSNDVVGDGFASPGGWSDVALQSRGDILC